MTATDEKWLVECPVEGVFDNESLKDALMSGAHGIDEEDFRERLGLHIGWLWDDIEFMIEEGGITAGDVDCAIHEGLTYKAASFR